MTKSKPTAKTGVKKISTNRHVRTRRDHATELAEDYVEAIDELLQAQEICRVTDLAARFAVSHVTVNRTVARLKRDGWVTTQPYGPVELTEAGRMLARASRQRHEIVLRFLITLGIREQTANIDAEGIEHHVSEETLRAMQRFVEKPGK
ncbi:MAG: manganese-binding transcriptional regulator MntR [Planctomycetaceae bacterium]